MTININTALSIQDMTRDFIRDKVGKLETYYDRIERADVFIKKGAGSGVEDVSVEIRLAVPGPDLFAEETSDSLEKAVPSVVDKLARQIRKHKDKISKR